MVDGKIQELIQQKRAFLQAALKDYAQGGNDMLDDVQTALQEAQAELSRNLELASCLREESEDAYQKECLSMYTAWVQKWFGKP
ncbi:MAG: hypothetical protein NWE92_08165 [Candidatus Bathyarchaeota archaeon]|nr:hypothetical protein [Candidatus Bathyarchaeota archaeon]